MPDASEPLGSGVAPLVAAVQTTLKDFESLRDYRAKYVHLAFSAVQTGCAIALAVEHLAAAAEALVDPTQGDTP